MSKNKNEIIVIGFLILSAFFLPIIGTQIKLTKEDRISAYERNPARLIPGNYRKRMAWAGPSRRQVKDDSSTWKVKKRRRGFL